MDLAAIVMPVLTFTAVRGVVVETTPDIEMAVSRATAERTVVAERPERVIGTAAASVSKDFTSPYAVSLSHSTTARNSYSVSASSDDMFALNVPVAVLLCLVVLIHVPAPVLRYWKYTSTLDWEPRSVREPFKVAEAAVTFVAAEVVTVGATVPS